VAVCTNFELHQYLTKKSNVKLSQFSVLEKYGRELEKNIYEKDIVPGLNIYGMFTTTKKELTGSGATMLFWFDMTHYLHSIGFRFLYARASNVKSYQNFVRYGADSITNIEGVENGQPVKFWWIRWWLRPIHVLNHMVDKFKERAHL
jgi:hypothetical protein